MKKQKNYSIDTTSPTKDTVIKIPECCEKILKEIIDYEIEFRKINEKNEDKKKK